MRMLAFATLSVVLGACASRATSSDSPRVPARVVVPASVRAGEIYRGLSIENRGDRGTWAGQNSTITLRTPHGGSKLVLVVYEPDDRNRALSATFAGRPEPWCCLHEGVSDVAFAVPVQDRRRPTITFALHVSNVRDPRYGVVLMRAFAY
ncbi:MAG TPA: hypothetical protein VMD47_00590 [Candidatus Acidoferrales bacterium]|nr:hypothetical protein [Candidatus Acidoferrales bacterium]